MAQNSNGQINQSFVPEADETITEYITYYQNEIVTREKDATVNKFSSQHTPRGVDYHCNEKEERNGNPMTDGHVGNVIDKGDPYRKYRVVKQTVLVIIWVCIGLSGEIVGPTLPDLKDRLMVNYEEVSRALLGKGIGMLFGAVIGGFINERFYRYVDVFMAACLMLMAVAAVVIPFSTVLMLTAAMFALNGMAEGIINTGGNTMVMHLWGEDTAPPMHSLHFGFGLGALLAPQVARSFLSPDALDDEDDDMTTVPYTTVDYGNSTVAPWEDLSKIEIPYCIIASLVFGFSLVLIGFFIKGPPKGFKLHEPNTNFKDMVSPASCAGGRTMYGVQLLVLLFVYYIQSTGGERAYGKFLFSFAIESDIKMRKRDASNLQTAFWASFTAGRGLGVPISKFVPLRYMMVGNVLGNIAVSVVLAIFAQKEVLILWFCSCIIGLFIAVVFPNGMSWANLRLNMNSMAVMVMMIGCSCGDFTYNYLTGFLFEKDPQNLMYVMVGYTVILAIVFVAMEAVSAIHGHQLILEEAHAFEQGEMDIVMTSHKSSPQKY